MSILEKSVNQRRHPRNCKFYDPLVKTKEIVLIDGFYQIPVALLHENSKATVTKVCDKCGKQSMVCYRAIIKQRKNRGNNIDLCQQCSCHDPIKKERQLKSLAAYYNNNPITDKERLNRRNGQLGRKYSEDSIKKRIESYKKTVSSEDYKLKRRKNNPQSLEDCIKYLGEEEGKKRYLNLLKNSPRRIEYFIVKGLTEEEAIEAVSKFQSRGLNYWTEKYGEEEGEERYAKIQVKKLRASNVRFSKESYEFFEFIITFLNLDRKLCFFGPEEIYIGLNKKERKFLGKNIIFIDFIYKNIAIEYNGSYWHQDFEEDKKRLEVIKGRGYKVVNIYSDDIKYRPMWVIKTIKELFNGN